MDTRQPPAQSLLGQLPESTVGAAREPAPVHLWNPPLSGELDMQIARDGTWYHEGEPITRLALAQLFSGILRLEEDGCYYLVTPVEKWAIRVDDVPFVVVRMETEGQGQTQQLRFFTSLEHEFIAGEEHPIRVRVDRQTGEPSPYVLLRDNLEALLSRNVFYQLAELAQEQEWQGQVRTGVWSSGVFFPIDGGDPTA